jgi:hypothetical protein
VSRLETYLYSRRNIAGSLLALGGLGLFFTGLVTGPIWIPITAGLYAIGALLVPPERGLDVRLNAAQDTSEVKDGLDRLVRSLRGKVADDLLAKVESIRASIMSTLAVEGAPGDAADPNVYLIRQTAFSYLPEAFATYLRMPRVIAERRRVANGRTPHDELLAQLDLMDRRLADVADDIARHDTDKLLANGRFLAEKFGTSSLDVEQALEAASAAAPAGEQVAQPAESKVAQTERERVH